eukprot:3738082-Alexandrium_andersonii.AAC.1
MANLRVWPRPLLPSSPVLLPPIGAIWPSGRPLRSWPSWRLSAPRSLCGPRESVLRLGSAIALRAWPRPTRPSGPTGLTLSLSLTLGQA